MTPATDATLYYLVVDVRDDRPVHVFFGSDPATGGGPVGEPVHLEVLPFHARFGRPARPAVGRPVLGQARSGTNRFREFASAADLWEAGFLPVAAYRVCDEWNDYHNPWAVPVSADHTVGADADDSV